MHTRWGQWYNTNSSIWWVLGFEERSKTNGFGPNSSFIRPLRRSGGFGQIVDNLDGGLGHFKSSEEYIQEMSIDIIIVAQSLLYLLLILSAIAAEQTANCACELLRIQVAITLQKLSFRGEPMANLFSPQAQRLLGWGNHIFYRGRSVEVATGHNFFFQYFFLNRELPSNLNKKSSLGVLALIFLDWELSPPAYL